MKLRPRNPWRLAQTRLAWWLQHRTPHLPEDEATALRWMVAGLTAIVLFETFLLILQGLRGPAPL